VLLLLGGCYAMLDSRDEPVPTYRPTPVRTTTWQPPLTNLPLPTYPYVRPSLPTIAPFPVYPLPTTR
jgi:hypothetical protein